MGSSDSKLFNLKSLADNKLYLEPEKHLLKKAGIEIAEVANREERRILEIYHHP